MYTFVQILFLDQQVVFCQFERIEPHIHHEAMKLLQSQLDKSYSVCDAVSFVLMKQRGVVDALTTDHHFDQAGLRRRDDSLSFGVTQEYISGAVP